MIQERHMKQAKRVANGEMATGYFRHGKHVMPCIIDEVIAFEVDPATVEDVAVKPRKTESVYGDVCPNCSMSLIGKANYCCNCGQHIDWN